MKKTNADGYVSKLPRTDLELYLLYRELDVPLDCSRFTASLSFQAVLSKLKDKKEEARQVFESKQRTASFKPAIKPAPVLLQEDFPLMPVDQNLSLTTPKIPPKAIGPLDNAFFTGGKSTPYRPMATSGGEVLRMTSPLREIREMSTPAPVVALPSASRPRVFTAAGSAWKRTFPWSTNLFMLNRHVFHNESFRENQEEVMNATLSGKDVFVCMPTGGGKSLTFQLPSLLDKGLTLVIMPLISLIHDQIQYLKSLGVRIRELNGNQSAGEQQSIYNELETDPEIKMLFVTPEKLAQSDKLSSFLKGFHSAKRLSRLVIDEAHCVSKWGRDFRADYLKLASFRGKFPNVPILALTATATDKVKGDVVQVLSMHNPIIFLASFNRPNLIYSVKVKPRNVIEDIANFIHSRHLNQTGLIYCISTKDCERVSKELKRTYKIKAGYYHAKMKPEKRTSVQERWMKDEIKVLAATVAFGMGINKANVRFVIHFSLPKSIENYYQESGRAGRDGNTADCVLYYNYGDKIKQDFLIHNSNRQEQRQQDNYSELNAMICYCEDVFTCRRKLQLAHFGEEFDATRCRRTCDNCVDGRVSVARDLTPQAILALKVFEGNRFGLNTMHQIAGLLKGGNNKQLEKLKYHECFGCLKHMGKEDIDKLMHKLVYEDVLREISVKSFKNCYHTNLELGTNANKLLNHQMQIVVLYEGKAKVGIPSGKNTPNSDNIEITAVQDRDPYQSSYELKNYSDQFSVRDLEEFKYEEKPVYSPEPEPYTAPPPALLEFGKCRSAELFHELLERLEIVRKKLAKKNGTDVQVVLKDVDLNTLCRELPTTVEEAERTRLAVPRELLKEIDYFVEVNNLKDTIEEEEPAVVFADSSDEEFQNPLSLKRKFDPASSTASEKRLKLDWALSS